MSHPVDKVVARGLCGACVLFATTLGLTAGCIDLAAPSTSPNDDAPKDDTSVAPGNDDVPQDLSNDGAEDALPPTDAADAAQPDGLASPARAPVAYWPLDEMRGARFEDRTARAGSGWALNGVTWVTAQLATALGADNRSALHFDGSNDYAILGTAGLPADGAPFTIALWVNAASTAAPQNFVHLTDGLRTGLALGVRGDNLVAVDGQNQILLSVPTAAAGQWQHLAFSYDAGTSRLFVGGELKAMVKTPPPLGAVLEAWLASARGRSAFFAGNLDDVRIYERALAETELAEIAAGAAVPELGPDLRPGSGDGGAGDAGGPPLPPIPDLVAYWKLDESTAGARAADATGNGNNAAPANAPVPSTPAPGLSFPNPRSLGFNPAGGTINQCALITTAPRLNFVGAITISAWIKPLVTTGSHQIVAHGSDTAETGLHIDSNTYVAYSRNSVRHAAVFAVPPQDVGEWVHLVGTHDGVAWRLYRNGSQVAVTEDDVGALYSNGYWSLGSSSNCATWFFQGSLDDVRIFRRALRPEEVRQLSNGAEY